MHQYLFVMYIIQINDLIYQGRLTSRMRGFHSSISIVELPVEFTATLKNNNNRIEK